MTIVTVEVTAKDQAEDDEIKVVDLDEVAGTETMLGCGNDNPF